LVQAAVLVFPELERARKDDLTRFIFKGHFAGPLIEWPDTSHTGIELRYRFRKREAGGAVVKAREQVASASNWMPAFSS